MRPRRLYSETTKSECEALVRLLKGAALTGAHLEIGTAAGGTLKEMMSCYPTERRPKFVVIDTFTYFEQQKLAVEENLRSVGINPASVEFRVGYSWPQLRVAQSRGDHFAFIFIDANHGLKYVTRDLRWTRLLEEGGYVCLHDYAGHHPGVVLAVDRFLRRNPNYSLVSRIDSLVILRKNGPGGAPEISALDLFHATVASTVRRWWRSLRKRSCGTRRDC